MADWMLIEPELDRILSYYDNAKNYYIRKNDENNEELKQR